MAKAKTSIAQEDTVAVDSDTHSYQPPGGELLSLS